MGGDAFARTLNLNCGTSVASGACDAVALSVAYGSSTERAKKLTADTAGGAASEADDAGAASCWTSVVLLGVLEVAG